MAVGLGVPLTMVDEFAESGSQQRRSKHPGDEFVNRDEVPANVDYEWVLNSLIPAIHRLGEDAATQIGWLESLEVPVDSADELALSFDQFAGFAQALRVHGRLSVDNETIIKTLDHALQLLSDEYDPDLWSFEALRSDARWQRIRDVVSQFDFESVTDP
jgi:hypothetical protein